MVFQSFSILGHVLPFPGENQKNSKEKNLTSAPESTCESQGKADPKSVPTFCLPSFLPSAVDNTDLLWCWSLFFSSGVCGSKLPGFPMLSMAIPFRAKWLAGFIFLSPLSALCLSCVCKGRQGHAKPKPLSTLDSNGSDRSLRTCLTGGGGVHGFVLVTLWDSGDQAGQFRCDGRPRSKAVFSSNAAMEAR